MKETGEKYSAALAAVVADDGNGSDVWLSGRELERLINEKGYQLARHQMPTLGEVDIRLWKLVGGDDHGTRTAFFGHTPHTTISSNFGHSGSTWRYPAGWNAEVTVGSSVVLRRNFPDVPYSQDDVPARAALHALAAFYWSALTETNPRWKTKAGALRFLKPELDRESAENAVIDDVVMLARGWRVLEKYSRGPVEAAEQADIQRIREELMRDASTRSTASSDLT